MITARSSAKHGLLRGRRLAAAVLICTLAGTAPVAFDADATGSPRVKVSAKAAEESAGVGNSDNTGSACPTPDQGQSRPAPLPCGAGTTPRDDQKPADTKTVAGPRPLSAAKHWERRGLLLLRWWRALLG